ncbi:MAG: HlyD family type I secretion periplasmic adaptor subunit [Bauldia sp.]
MAAFHSDPRPAIRRLNIVAMATIAVLIGAIGGWAATSNLAGAVIARGTLVVESSVKRVQHPTGGTIGEILVEEGRSVAAGDVLIRLDETMPRANLNIVRAEFDTQLIRQARLMAERDDATDIVVPPSLAARAEEPEIATAFASEQKLFQSRRATVAGQHAQLAEQVDQLKEQIGGLEAQRTAKESELRLLAQEFAGVEALFAKQLTTRERMTALERSRASIEGERGQIVAEIAAARGKISETELQSLQIDKAFRTEALNDLRDAETRIAAASERTTAAEDQLRRIDIRAPQAGTVHGLAVHTVGGVIGPGETIMMIVPSADSLVIDAMVAPQDVDQITVGAEASVRIMSGNTRVTPVVKARIVRVSPDLLQNPETKNPGYLVRAAFDKGALGELGDLHVLAGMPVELFVATGERTPLGYLLRPLGEQIAHTFRER